MSHDPHEFLPGYSPSQLLHDECAECEWRAGLSDHGIANLDSDTFARAWERAGRLVAAGLPDAARAEVPMLRALGAVQVQLQRRGVPLGEVPGE